jgi:Rrf2 family cysteine metabolism transcriptional repressor
MKFLTETRYAVRIMIDLAQHEGERVPVKAIARRQGISAKYSERIVARLRFTGLVKSMRGVHGGYVLARPAREITIGEIVQRIDGPRRVSEDVRDRPFEAAFEQIQVAAWGVLDALTLEEVAGR